ncbi:MAG: DUF1365 domain-containing protein [Gammaproteobacteria bacterium]|nr:DUF1365 domain-containing protein [Gammaproteobacteria bacterium]NNL99313.1 DUF1365 domain-containing protein [Gammaproteobacteria bacterium]
MKSRLYEGAVVHRRFSPRPHGFAYRLFMLCLDLDELDEVFAGRWLWSNERANLASFRRADHVGPADVPLKQAVGDVVEEQCGVRPAGRIELVTHLRYFGYVMNPVSFYYCWDEQDERVQYVVAEVHNTPWGERHCYVMDCAPGESGATRRFNFPKAFHVSPFMPMRQRYDWRVGEPRDALMVVMENHEQDATVFRAAMRMTARPLTGSTLASALARFPLMTVKVIGAIYWQALRLRLKGISFHPHPRHSTEPGATDEHIAH